MKKPTKQHRNQELKEKYYKQQRKIMQDKIQAYVDTAYANEDSRPHAGEDLRNEELKFLCDLIDEKTIERYHFRNAYKGYLHFDPY